MQCSKSYRTGKSVPCSLTLSSSLETSLKPSSSLRDTVSRARLWTALSVRVRSLNSTAFGLTDAELCYQFMYIEPNGRRPPRDVWSFRQTGAYHRFEASTQKNCVVLLHPNDEAKAQARLESFLEPTKTMQLGNHPLNLHLVVISSYIVHWQDHTVDLASELEQIVIPQLHLFEWH